MATLKTVNLQHPDASVPNLVLQADGTVDSASPLLAGIGSNVVQTVKTDAFSTSSASYVAVNGLTVTITPSSDTSKILVVATIGMESNVSGTRAHARLSGGNTSSFVGDASGSAVRSAFSANLPGVTAPEFGTLFCLDEPATDSPVTYGVEVRRGTGGGTFFVNRAADTTNADRGAWVGTITAIEVAA